MDYNSSKVVISLQDYAKESRNKCCQHSPVSYLFLNKFHNISFNMLTKTQE